MGGGAEQDGGQGRRKGNGGATGGGDRKWAPEAGEGEEKNGYHRKLLAAGGGATEREARGVRGPEARSEFAVRRKRRNPTPRPRWCRRRRRPPGERLPLPPRPEALSPGPALGAVTRRERAELACGTRCHGMWRLASSGIREGIPRWGGGARAPQGLVEGTPPPSPVRADGRGRLRSRVGFRWRQLARWGLPTEGVEAGNRCPA